MKTIKIHKAMGFDKPEIDGIALEINTPLDDIIPIDQSVIENDMKTYEADAKLIFDALAETLPSSTLDQLLILLLQERVNRFNTSIRNIVREKKNG